MADSDFEVRVEAAIQGHTHPDDVRVIEHPGYEPYVKLNCYVCGSETYVRRTLIQRVSLCGAVHTTDEPCPDCVRIRKQ